MYMYLRNMLDVADLVGDVEDIVFMDWGTNEKRVQVDGKRADGKKFRLILECEVEKDGD